MNMSAYREELRLKLTGGVLDLELSDSTLDSILNSALREIRRYIDSTKLITIPYKSCINLSEVTDDEGNPIKVSSVSRIYRTDGFASSSGNSLTPTDPMLASQWQMVSGTGNMAEFQNYAYNYMAYNTLLQIRNTTTTDLSFMYNKEQNMLYVNVATNAPQMITIEYVCRYDHIEDIKSDYWIDILMRMSVALAKIAVGRIRSRFTQSNALWQQDGQQLLDEGNSELSELRQHLVDNATLLYPVD